MAHIDQKYVSGPVTLYLTCHWYGPPCSALSQNQIEKQKIKVLKRKHCRAHGALACNDYIPPDTWNRGDTMRTSLLTIENLISVQV